MSDSAENGEWRMERIQDLSVEAEQSDSVGAVSLTYDFPSKRLCCYRNPLCPHQSLSCGHDEIHCNGGRIGHPSKRNQRKGAMIAQDCDIITAGGGAAATYRVAVRVTIKLRHFVGTSTTLTVRPTTVPTTAHLLRPPCYSLIPCGFFE